MLAKILSTRWNFLYLMYKPFDSTNPHLTTFSDTMPKILHTKIISDKLINDLMT